MMKYNEWKLITESLTGGMTLGLSRPNVIGGPIGSQFNEDDFDTDDEEEEDFGDEEEEEDADDDTLDGDLMGSSDDEGVDKSFPPDDSEEMDGLPAPDEEMSGDSSDSLEQDDDFGSSLSNALGSPSKDTATDGTGEGDMDFLNDIDPNLLGGEDGGDPMADVGDSAEAGMPCPDCNPDGDQEVGEEGCPSCDGTGFTDAEEGGESDMASDMAGLLGDDLGDDSDMPVDDLSGDVDPAMDQSSDAHDLISRMASYMGKYMKKESAQYEEPVAKTNVKAAKKFTKNNEGSDFLNSLCRQTEHDANKKFGNGMSEDALFSATDPTYDREEQPGQVGYAPLGRVGSIGGGYTKSDFADIPVLGESTRFPTLKEWSAKRAKQIKNKK